MYAATSLLGVPLVVKVILLVDPFAVQLVIGADQLTEPAAAWLRTAVVLKYAVFSEVVGPSG
jgi:hypothetical protein